VAGTAYRARIMPLKVLNARGFGNVADIAEAIRFAADNGAKVINMSLGSSRPSRIMSAAVKYAYDKGVTVVCAAGNDGRGKVGYPAANPGAVAVAATQYDRTTTFYSNWGKEIDLAAPGGNTRVDQNNDGMPDGVLQNTILINKPAENDYLLFMGTSMASPHVAGAAAIVVQRGVSKPAAVEKLLKATANHPGGKKWDPHYGAGIIDVAKAIDKSTTTWGAIKLGLGGLLGLLLVLRLRSRGLLGLRVGAGVLAGLVLGSSGLFFLSSLGLTGSLPGGASHVLTHGFPAWGAAALGPGANPLFYSLLAPLALTALLYGTRLRSLVFGFCVGVAAHLLFCVGFDTNDVAWIPNVLALDQIWLAINGLVCLGLAYMVARKKTA
jgi:serine protease